MRGTRDHNDDDGIEELLMETEGRRWDTMLLCRKMGNHRDMGSGSGSQKHGAGLLLERWKRKIVKTEYVSERMILTIYQTSTQENHHDKRLLPSHGCTNMHDEKMEHVNREATATRKYTKTGNAEHKPYLNPPEPRPP